MFQISEIPDVNALDKSSSAVPMVSVLSAIDASETSNTYVFPSTNSRVVTAPLPVSNANGLELVTATLTVSGAVSRSC